MEQEFSKYDKEKDEKSKSTKKCKQKIDYEKEKEQDNNQQIHVEKDIKQQILEICLQIFPYPQPYSVQVDCMKSIIESLCEKKNLLFQSPTGTGKTLVTICSALAYAQINPFAQILVLTRTNEQINGFIKEIRKIEKYADIGRYSILAGRGSFCLYFDKFKQQFDQQLIQKSKQNKHLSQICNKMIKKIKKAASNYQGQFINMDIFQRCKQVDIYQINSQDNKDQKSCEICPHYLIYKQMKEKKDRETIQKYLHFPQVRYADDQPYTLPDIEDMKKLFQQEKLGCPFYFNKLATQNAKLIFSTYNYVIKQNILASIKYLFKGKVIVIFDEAHNISEQAEQEQSTKMTYKYFEQFNNSLEAVQKVFQKPQNNQRFLKLYQDIRVLIQLDIQEESKFLEEQLLQYDMQRENENAEADYDDEDEELPNIKHAKYKAFAVRAQQKQSQRKFYKKILLTSKDLYDQVLTAIQQNSQVSKRQQEIQNYIKDSNIDNIFKLYQEQRIKEVYNFLDNYQNIFLTIKEKSGFLEKIFDEHNKYQIQPFCKLFSEKQLGKHFEQLKVNDINTAQNFMDNIIKVFKIIYYIKKLIQINTQDEQKGQQNQHSQGKNIIVKENNNDIYEANINYKKDIKILGEQIQINCFSKIWYFFYRLLKMKTLYDSQKNPLYLSNHYISLLRKEKELFLPTLQIGCLSASYLFKKIYKKINISSLILTSGTLEPFDLIQKSLALEFQTYSSPHIINSQTNLFTQFISSYEGQDICFSQKKLEKEEMKNKIFLNSQIVLNKIISKLNRYTQQVNKKCGIVIFFKSYQMLQQCKYLINQKNNLDFILFEETKNAKDFKEQYSSYKQFIQQNKFNCIFLAVNRGKLSEGIDLKDDLCRTVILFGVPYANLSDPYIKCKITHAQLYLGENLWYKKEAIKVINQSAGRCIRHKDDWGSIFFIDSQYVSETNIYQHISKWILEGQRKMNQNSEHEWIEAYDKFLDIKAQEKTDQVYN